MPAARAITCACMFPRAPVRLLIVSSLSLGARTRRIGPKGRCASALLRACSCTRSLAECFQPSPRSCTLRLDPTGARLQHVFSLTLGARTLHMNPKKAAARERSAT